MKALHEELTELLSTDTEDHLACPKHIRIKAMDLLARREYGLSELTSKLANKGYQRSVIEDVLGQLANEGLQSDARYAEAFVQSRINKGKGPVRIRMELGQRGIPDSFIVAAIEEAAVDWCALADQVRVRKFGSEKPADYKEKARQMRFLQYRGFDTDHIQSVI